MLHGGDGIDTAVDTSGANVYLDLVPNAVSPVWTLWVDEMTDIALSMEQMTETVDDLLITVAAAEATRR